MLELKNISKVYELSKSNKIIALNNVNINFDNNKFYGIVGHSGSGKSTLIQILGLLDSYDTGEYLIDNKSVTNLTDDEKSKLRMNKFGFVFQSFYLNPKLTAKENIIIPTLINNKIKSKERNELALKLLDKVGLKNRVKHKPSQLSGGEQQRVALARALVNNPEIIIADEPTGNLDEENETIIFDLLKELVAKEGKTVIVVTHNEIIKQYADEIIYIEEGIIKSRSTK